MRNRLLPLFRPDTLVISAPARYRRKAILFGLFTLLFFTGVFTDALYLFLDRSYERLFTSLGWYALLNKSQAEVSSLLTMRSWPTMVTYGLLYTALSFLFLHIYFNQRWKTWIVAGLYGFIFLLCCTLILTGKVVPEAEWAYKLCRRLIEMVISPLPVFLLIAALSKAKF